MSDVVLATGFSCRSQVKRYEGARPKHPIEIIEQACNRVKEWISKDQNVQEITNQEELSAWVREQFQKANKHLAENQVLFESVVTEESRYLAPYCAVWKIKDTENKFYWVVSGDVPTDYVEIGIAPDARAAMKHFSLSWRLSAENIRRDAKDDEQQLAIAKSLDTGARNLYDVAHNDQVWEQQGA